MEKNVIDITETQINDILYCDNLKDIMVFFIDRKGINCNKLIKYTTDTKQFFKDITKSHQVHFIHYNNFLFLNLDCDDTTHVYESSTVEEKLSYNVVKFIGIDKNNDDIVIDVFDFNTTNISINTYKDILKSRFLWNNIGKHNIHSYKLLIDDEEHYSVSEDLCFNEYYEVSKYFHEYFDAIEDSIVIEKHFPDNIKSNRQYVEIIFKGIRSYINFKSMF